MVYADNTTPTDSEATVARAKGSSSIKVRWAEVRDAENILQIYAPYIESTAITFETRVPSLDEFCDRMKEIVCDYPYLAVEDNGRIVGYAYAHRQGVRAAYAWNAELSIYFDPAYTKRGWGQILAQAVIDLLELQGVRNVFSLVALPNKPSIAMHEALGFQHIGTQRNAGFKLGAWHDVAWMQKQIGAFEGTPEQRLTVLTIDFARAQDILTAAGRAMSSTLR